MFGNHRFSVYLPLFSETDFSNFSIIAISKLFNLFDWLVRDQWLACMIQDTTVSVRPQARAFKRVTSPSAVCPSLLKKEFVSDHLPQQWQLELSLEFVGIIVYSVGVWYIYLRFHTVRCRAHRKFDCISLSERLQKNYLLHRRGENWSNLSSV